MYTYTHARVYVCGGQRSVVAAVPQEVSAFVFETESLPGLEIFKKPGLAG